MNGAYFLYSINFSTAFIKWSLVFLFSAFIEFTCKDYLTALNWAIAWLLVSILPLIIFDSKKIKESYERTKNNPEYIQKLSDLGCTNIAIRIDPYYK